MNKKALSCLTALALLLTLCFSAGAVCSRAFVADVILPPDGDGFTSAYEPVTDTAQTTVPETYAVERVDISDEVESLLAEAEDETVLLYGAAEVPADHTLPDVEIESGQQSLVKPVVICLVIGAVIALVVVLAVKSSYKPVHRKRDAAEYLVDGSLNVTAADEKFTRSERSERKIQTKDSDK